MEDEDSKEIADAIYRGYGSDSRYLFGIEPKHEQAVRSIIKLAITKKRCRKLKRDAVVSIVGGKELVGIYFADTDGSVALLECSPDTADKILELWNNEIER